MRVLQANHSVRYEEMAIITPYKAQKELIRSIMKREGFRENRQPCVVTIMESQGKSEYILLLALP